MVSRPNAVQTALTATTTASLSSRIVPFQSHTTWLTLTGSPYPAPARSCRAPGGSPSCSCGSGWHGEREETVRRVGVRRVQGVEHVLDGDLVVGQVGVVDRVVEALALHV